MKRYDWKKESLKYQTWKRDDLPDENSDGQCIPQKKTTEDTNSTVNKAAKKVFLWIIAILFIGVLSAIVYSNNTHVPKKTPSPAPNEQSPESPPKRIVPKITIYGASETPNAVPVGKIYGVIDNKTEMEFTANAICVDSKDTNNNLSAKQLHDNFVKIHRFFESRFNWVSLDSKNAEIKVYYACKIGVMQKVDQINQPTKRDIQFEYNGQKYFIKYDNLKTYDNACFYTTEDFDTWGFLFGEYPIMTTLGVIAHEYMHGITHYRVNEEVESVDADGIAVKKKIDMIYFGESGALNEAFSDIFSCFAVMAINDDHDSKSKLRWQLGNSIGRNLKDPHNSTNLINGEKCSYPKRYKDDPFWMDVDYSFIVLANKVSKNEANDNEMRQFIEQIKKAQERDNYGVHINSTVIGHLAYLICDGGAESGKPDIQALGEEKTSQLFWELNRSMTVTSTFSHVFQNLLAAAERLNLSADEKDSIIKACQSVGLSREPHNSGSSHNTKNGLMFFCTENKLGRIQNFFLKTPDELALSVQGTSPEDAVMKFTNKYHLNLGSSDKNEKFHISRRSNNTFILTQRIGKIPVFGASAMVQTNDKNQITNVINSFSSMAYSAIEPVKTIDIIEVKKRLKKLEPRATFSSPVNFIFDPSMFGFSGNPSYVWSIDSAIGQETSMRYLIDKNTGDIVFMYPLTRKSVVP